jgi:hypothetical protein
MKTEAKIILTGAFVVMLFGLLSNAILNSDTTELGASSEEGSFACTMDAKVCPDGTYVGRIPPYCQFAACESADSLSNR